MKNRNICNKYSSQEKDLLNMLRLALARTPSNISHLLKDNGNKLRMGQVWTLRTNNFLCLVAAPPREDILEMIPLFRWTENAGPEDLFLPTSFLGTEMLASFELKCSLPTACLADCRGRLPGKDIKFIEGAHKEISSGKKKDSRYTWGWNYIDENDIRYKFHEDCIEKIQILQEPIWERIKTISGSTYTKGKTFIIQFPELQAECKLAARSLNKSPFKKVMHSPQIPEFVFIFTEERDSSFVHLNILLKKSPSADLDGVKIYAKNGEMLATVKDSKARLHKEKIIDGIFLKDTEGKDVSLSIAPI